MVRLLAHLFFVIMLVGGGAFAQSFPSLTGRVVDQAGMLSPNTRQELELKLKAFETKSSDQLVVVTVNSLEGYEIADYANRLFRHWKIGQAKQNNGILLIISKNDRKVRIEVGYGLEGQVTDALARYIIEGAIVPKFKAGDVDGGVRLATDSLIKVLSNDDGEMKRRAEAHEKTKTANVNNDALWPFLIIILIFLMFFFNARRNQSARMGQGGFLRRNNPGWVIIPGSFGGDFGSSSGGFGGGFSGGGGSSGGGGASGSW